MAHEPQGRRKGGKKYCRVGRLKEGTQASDSSSVGRLKERLKL